MFENKSILIHGLSISNIEVIKYLKDKNIKKLTITDLKDENELAELAEEAKEIFPKAELILGEHREEDFTSCDLIIRNTSIPLSSKYLKLASEKGIPIETDISLFMKLSPSKNIIGITGTKGKTTTTFLIYEMLKDQGLNVITGGNNQIPIMGELTKVKKDTWIVIEFSSWMIESIDVYKISPRVAVYTNLLVDHINYYKTVEDYHKSKEGLFKYQTKNDLLLINAEDKKLENYTKNAKAKIIKYKKEDLPSDITLKLKGEHYRSNAAAAYVLAKELNLDLDKIENTLKNFNGVEHRMEYLGEHNNITFINNTTATNPDSFIADLKTVVKEEKSIYLLCGGADKNLDFKEMISLINNTKLVEKIALFKGEATDKLIQDVDKDKILGVFDNMSDAFKEIVKSVSTDKESIVFLNPGCASFGVFKNEFDRGEQFRKKYLQLIKE